ncbi:hypothetical protein ASPFODRAFT_333447 [Aspergillus luchuensis CBS 106.47]|uniref:Uncharacterized protein n=1 Tax=Aspergillus luchuensis (strain CBS 106.47) TaxID=1137211 RepID=A0A1M3T7W8_ASPLC|nr:hypothetical protein ASPFODRAFT_333447 [Aspergillus luchuensis CBS 106.47]
MTTIYIQHRCFSTQTQPPQHTHKPAITNTLSHNLSSQNTNDLLPQPTSLQYNPHTPQPQPLNPDPNPALQPDKIRASPLTQYGW